MKLGKLIPVVDFVMIPFIYVSAVVLSKIKKIGLSKFKNTKKILMRVGIFPIANHYYEPLFDTSVLKKSLRDDRNLPGIDMNRNEQLELLNQFNFENELFSIPENKENELEYYYNNGSFCSGDSEALYCMIRHFKPKRIIEIGSGFSSLMSLKALEDNKKADSGYNFEFTCIEPYEMPWLEKTGVNVIRKRVEDIDTAFIGDHLDENDILFIDSSHIIRPQGDVLFEYLEILPILKKGVLIHIHDIFTPKDYLDEWIKENNWMWNEQYLLEAFLSFNKDYKIILALNYLFHNHREIISKKFPILNKQAGREPGSIWLVKC